jgi:hypothetical protein
MGKLEMKLHVFIHRRIMSLISVLQKQPKEDDVDTLWCLILAVAAYVSECRYQISYDSLVPMVLTNALLLSASLRWRSTLIMKMSEPSIRPCWSSMFEINFYNETYVTYALTAALYVKKRRKRSVTVCLSVCLSVCLLHFKRKGGEVRCIISDTNKSLLPHIDPAT